MDIYEETVLNYLTRDQATFVIPQFSIKKEWSCPDFVTICPSRRECFVVEVSTAYNLDRLAEKVRNREAQWIQPLRQQLEKTGTTDVNWKYGCKVFIRKKRNVQFQRMIGNAADVTLHDIETTLANWSPEFYAL